MNKASRKKFVEWIVSAMTEGDDILPYKSYNLGTAEVTVSNLLQQRPYTAVEIAFIMRVPPYKTIVSTGFTKVCYPDRWDPEYGKELAVKKAAAQIAREIEVDWAW
jgi:hypothetical protein